MAKRKVNRENEDGTVYCCKCDSSFDLDHFYISKKKSGKNKYCCREGRSRRQNKLDRLGLKRKEGSKAMFHIPLEDGNIYCGDCKNVFPEAHFNIIQYKNRKYNDNLIVQYTCKQTDIRFSEDNPCRLYDSNHKKTPKDYRKDAQLQREYGITLDDYNRMFVEQNGCCQICKKHQSELSKPLFVDHNHSNQEVRGLLCPNCNTGIGVLKEDVKILLSAIEYIEKYNK